MADLVVDKTAHYVFLVGAYDLPTNLSAVRPGPEIPWVGWISAVFERNRGFYHSHAHWFTTLREAKEIIEAWRREYNESRPHRALGELTPIEFACRVAASRDLTGPQGAENSL